MKYFIISWAHLSYLSCYRSKEQYVQTGYTRNIRELPWPVQVLQNHIDYKVLFAGEAIPIDSWSWGYAHGAALSGKRAANVIISTFPTPVPTRTDPPTVSPSKKPSLNRKTPPPYGGKEDLKLPRRSYYYSRKLKSSLRGA